MDLNKFFDPTGEREKEFDRIWDTIAGAPKPKTDYSKLSHPDFIRLHFLRRLLEIQASFMAILRSAANMYRVFKVVPAQIKEHAELSLEEIMQWAQALTPKVLYENYCTYPAPVLTGLLLDLKIEEVFMEAELGRRFESKKVASEFVILDWGGLDRTKEIKRLLQVDKIKSFRPWEQEDSDIKQEALTKALELWREPGNVPVEESSPLPAFPLENFLPMLPSEREFWDGPMARAWEDGKKAWLRAVIPVLQGEKETIPQKVREQRREEWRKIARREKLYKDHQEQIKGEVHPELEEKTNAAPDISSQMLTVLRIAKKRWGSKAVKALRYYAEGKTEEEAAALAGITSRSLRNYISKLNKELSSKK
ncbi:hypothetical protein EPO44_05805 [bacterium]|nr:MAG: hypothetical protein EPO44_05805 [bacterium]